MQLGLVPTGTTDDCNESEWEEVGVSVVLGDCPTIVTLTCTFQAVDACGNVSETGSTTINVVDNTAPDLVMPEQTFIHITCTAVQYGTLLDLAAGNLSTGQANTYRNFLRNIFMVNGLVPIGAEDNCGDAEVEEIDIDIITDGLSCPSKALVRCVFVAIDECGNQSEPQYTELIVIDQTTPHVFCPSDIVVNCGSDTSPAATGFATASDNCSGDVVIDYYDTSVSDFCPTSFVRVWTATDGCGNFATCEQLITLVEEEDCSTPATGLVAEVVGQNTVELSWNPVPGSIARRIFARLVGMNSSITVATLIGIEPSGTTITSPKLKNGREIEWRVICACSTDPLVTTPFSAWSSFTFFWDEAKGGIVESSGDEDVNLAPGRIYPNPTRSSTFLDTKFNEGDVILVRDLSGMTVASFNAPTEGGLFEIDMDKLAAGVYFVQHMNRDGVPHVYKVVKN